MFDKQTAQAAGGFAILAVCTLALFLLGAPVLVVGILVWVLQGVTWPVVTGCVVLAGAAGMGWSAHRWARRWRESLEKPRRHNQIFISYRTAEHESAAERLARLLREEGIGVFFAPSGNIAVDSNRPLTAFRQLGLFQMGELDADLQRALMESDAMIYCVPATKRRLGIWQSMKDSLDAVFSMLLFQSGLTLTYWRFMWYSSMYGRHVAPAMRLFGLQSWQAWELAVAQQLGLVVVRLAFDEAKAEADDEAVSCGLGSLERDFKEKALPRLRGVTAEPPEVKGPLPIMAVAVIGMFALKFAGLLSLLAVAVFLLVRTVS